MEKEASRANEEKNLKMKLLWTVVFFVIAALTIFAITSQEDFSFKNFLSFFKGLNPIWLCAAVIAMLGFIFFEGVAVKTILNSFGFKIKMRKCFIYSSSDIYFSAITPSSTGGQPASMYFMMRDGISGSAATLALLVNLVMYSLSIIIIGIVSFIISPSVFLGMNALTKALVIIGVIAITSLALFMVLVIYKSAIMHKLGDFGLTLLAKIHIIRNLEGKKQKLASVIDSYNGHVERLKGKAPMLLKALLFNVLQRSSVVLVTVFVYLSTGGCGEKAVLVGIAQCVTILATNILPIPGAMLASDAVLIHAFGVIGLEAAATHLNLVSRGISFYSCVIICGISLIVRIIAYNVASKKQTLNEEVTQ